MKFRPAVVVNQVKSERDANTGKVLQQVAERYLALEVRDFGAIPHDPQIQRFVARMAPLTSVSQHRGACEAVYAVASRFVHGDGRIPLSLARMRNNAAHSA